MRTLWIILGVYVLWRIINRYLTVRKFVKNVRNQNFQEPPPPRKEGEVNIIGKKDNQSQKTDCKGDYVDFEEV